MSLNTYNSLYYTGVGSRKTPQHVLELMKAIARKLAREGYKLRTGDADGADKAFSDTANEEVVFGGNWLDPQDNSEFCPYDPHIYRAADCTPAAMEISSRFHPAWNRCSDFAKKLHGRNAFQVLGPNLDEPSKFLICWTPDGCTSHATRSIKTGGTGTAISIADAYGVAVHNLANQQTYDMWVNWLHEVPEEEKFVCDTSKLKVLYTAHYRYGGPDRTDITAKGKDPMGKHFAPLWEMVMGIKNGTMPEQEYIKLYCDQLAHTVPTHAWEWFLSQEERTLVCFCPKENFCHRNILVNYILDILGDRIKYMGWRN